MKTRLTTLFTIFFCLTALLHFSLPSHAINPAIANISIQSASADKVEASSEPVNAPKEESVGAKIWFYVKGITILAFFVFAIVYITMTLIRKPRFTPITLEEMKAKRRDQGKPESSVIDDEAALIDVNQAFNTWKIISKPGEEELRSPMSMGQIKASYTCLESAIRSLPTDPEIIANINDLGVIINNQEKRRFTGSMKLIYCGIAACVIGYFMGDGFGMWLKHFWWLPVTIILYYFASYSPEFLNSKRERWFRGFNIHNVLIGTIIGLFASTAATETWKTTYSDGSTKTSEEVNPFFIVMFILTILVVLVLGFFTFVFAGLNFVRNYLIYA